mmetsp:Transcript_1368/g.2925  ORF Transcript_1368/g.2925 Transcript_1368/m.2925 type:complete len:320 (-) Transcript_1368:146-1105(-)
MTKDDDEAEEEKAATQPVVPSIPIPIPGAEPAIGPQVNSLRPSSARYSFARDKKKDAWSGEGTPGPGYYSMDYANALVCASAASMGTAAARSHCSETRRSLKKEKSDPNTHLHVMEAWVTSTAAGPSPRIGFGTETREAQVSDLELLRACPESRYGSGPGLVYNPDYRRVRPESAGRSFARDKSGGLASSVGGTSGQVAPSSYQHHDQESISGKQLDSRKRTGPAFSFGRASRFMAPRRAMGGRAEECASARSSLGRSETGRRQRRPPSATFGCADRDAARKVVVAAERPLSARLPPRLPHPVLVPRQEMMKFDPTGQR